MRDVKGLLIVGLVIFILILLGIMAYVFAIKPAISNYVIGTQNQGIDFALAIIVQQIQQNGYVQIPIGNQTLILVPVQPQAINTGNIGSASLPGSNQGSPDSGEGSSNSS